MYPIFFFFKIHTQVAACIFPLYHNTTFKITNPCPYQLMIDMLLFCCLPRPISMAIWRWLSTSRDRATVKERRQKQWMFLLSQNYQAKKVMQCFYLLSHKTGTEKWYLDTDCQTHIYTIYALFLDTCDSPMFSHSFGHTNKNLTTFVYLEMLLKTWRALSIFIPMASCSIVSIME